MDDYDVNLQMDLVLNVTLHVVGVGFDEYNSLGGRTEPTRECKKRYLPVHPQSLQPAHRRPVMIYEHFFIFL